VQVLVAEDAATAFTHPTGIHWEFLAALVAFRPEHRFAKDFHLLSCALSTLPRKIAAFPCDPV